MKTTIKTTGVLILVLFCVNVFAQNAKPNLPEKLTLLFNNQVKMVIESTEILNIPLGIKQDILFKNLVMDIGKVQDSLVKINTPLILYYNTIDGNIRKLKVTYNPQTQAEFIFKGNSDTVSSSFFKYKIECSLNLNNKLILYSNKLNDLSSLNGITFSDILLQAKSDIIEKKIASYKAKTCTYKVNNSKVDVSNAEINKQSSFIISPGMDFGISYMNDRFLSNISMSVGYIFAPKVETKAIVGISATGFVNMEPNNECKMQYNYFVDAFFQAKDPKNLFYYARDTKLYVGYLVHREGDLFRKSSWRLGLDMPAGENFRIVYAVYFGKLKKDNASLFEIGVRYKFF